MRASGRLFLRRPGQPHGIQLCPGGLHLAVQSEGQRSRPVHVSADGRSRRHGVHEEQRLHVAPGVRPGDDGRHDDGEPDLRPADRLVDRRRGVRVHQFRIRRAVQLLDRRVRSGDQHQSLPLQRRERQHVLQLGSDGDLLRLPAVDDQRHDAAGGSLLRRQQHDDQSVVEPDRPAVGAVYQAGLPDRVQLRLRRRHEHLHLRQQERHFQHRPLHDHVLPGEQEGNAAGRGKAEGQAEDPPNLSPEPSSSIL